MFDWSSTSAATILQERQRLRAARKYFAASFGFFDVGCETWLPSFQAPNVLTLG